MLLFKQCSDVNSSVDFSRRWIWGKVGTGVQGICLKSYAKFHLNRTMCSGDAIRPQPLMNKKRFKHKTLAVEYGVDNDKAEVLLNLQYRLHNCILHIVANNPQCLHFESWWTWFVWGVWAVMLSLEIRPATPKTSILGLWVGPDQLPNRIKLWTILPRQAQLFI